MKTESSSQNQRSLQVSAETENAKFAIIVSRFNSQITDGLLEGARRTFMEYGISKESLDTVFVPGAFEIPLVAKKLAQGKKYAGILCLGAVIKGDTAHFEYVCQGLTQGLMTAMLETGVPLSFGVLTTLTLEQALIRSGLDSESYHSNKGREAALACLETVDLLSKVSVIV